jgi:hypothetical protein
MSKPKEEKKKLRKQIVAIKTIYDKAKGKENRKALKKFIIDKLDEIKSFQGTLKGKKKKKSKDGEMDEIIESSNLQPSPELLTELTAKQRTKNRDGAIVNEVA